MIGKDYIEKLGSLMSWDAVIQCALDSRAISLKQAERLRRIDWKEDFSKFVSRSDTRVLNAEQMRKVPAGAFIAFIRVDPPDAYFRFINKPLGRRRIIHAMVSLGDGWAVGTNNKSGIGIGNDREWELLDLARDLNWINGGINAVQLGIDKSRQLRIRYRELEEVRKMDAESPGGSVSVSIENLTLDLMKRVSIAPMHGVVKESRGAKDWELITVAKDKGKLDMRLIPALSPDLGGAWMLTTLGIGWTAPVYFLPWLSKRIVKLEIGNDCPIFATAALTGCSIFTKGEESAPTIFHAGIDGSVKGAGYTGDADIEKAASTGDKALFWRLLLAKQLEPNVMDDKGWSEVNLAMYISDETLAHTYRDINRTVVKFYTTKRAKSVAEAVKAAHKEIEWDENTGSPWGSYLGFRDVHGKWSMYLQENIFFTYADQKTKKRYATSFPIALSQVYPPGMESTNLITDVPSKIANPFTPSDTVVEG